MVIKTRLEKRGGERGAVLSQLADMVFNFRSLGVWKQRKGKHTEMSPP